MEMQMPWLAWQNNIIFEQGYIQHSNFLKVLKVSTQLVYPQIEIDLNW